MNSAAAAASEVSIWVEWPRRRRRGGLGVPSPSDLVELPGDRAVAVRLEYRRPVGTEPLAPAQRLERAGVGQEGVAAAIVKMSEHHESRARVHQLLTRQRTVPGLIRPLLAGEGSVDQEQMAAAVLGARQSVTALVEQCLAVNAAPHTVTSRSSGNGSIRSFLNTWTFWGQLVRCHTEPGM